MVVIMLCYVHINRNLCKFIRYKPRSCNRTIKSNKRHNYFFPSSLYFLNSSQSNFPRFISLAKLFNLKKAFFTLSVLKDLSMGIILATGLPLLLINTSSPEITLFIILLNKMIEIKNIQEIIKLILNYMREYGYFYLL